MSDRFKLVVWPFLGLLAAGFTLLSLSLAKRAENTLRQSVETSIANTPSAAWLKADVSGQTVLLTGEAPSTEERAAAIETAFHAAGPGGWLQGGVAAVDVSGLVIAPALEPAATESGETAFVSASADKSAVPTPRQAPRLKTAKIESTAGRLRSGGLTGDENITPDELVETCQRAANSIKERRPITFLAESTRLSVAEKVYLRRLAEVLRGCGAVRVAISGHTDSTGSTRSNLVLSKARAEAVRAFLATEGVGAARLTALGHGETQPLATNRTRAGRARNRRIDIAIDAGP